MEATVLTQYYTQTILNSSVNLDTGWMAGVPFPAGVRDYFYFTESTMALGPTQTPIRSVPGTLSLGLKLTEHEAEHSLPSSAEVKNVGAITLLPHMAS
jgi:hypothetical protein